MRGSVRRNVRVREWSGLAGLDPTRGREIAKTRPVVVVSLGAMNRHLDTAVVCPLTTRLHPRRRSRIQCACGGRRAEIAVDQIRTVSRERLGRRVDRLAPSLAAQLRQLITETYAESQSPFARPIHEGARRVLHAPSP